MLASASPRRLGLLRNIGVHPEVRPADIDETPRAGEGPAAYVQRLAAAKAAAVARDGEVVIAADTTVSIDGHLHELMASPARDAGAARRPHELEGGHAGGPKSPGVAAKSPFALRSTVPSRGGQKTSSVMADTAAEYVSRA